MGHCHGVERVESWRNEKERAQGKGEEGGDLEKGVEERVEHRVRREAKVGERRKKRVEIQLSHLDPPAH